MYRWQLALDGEEVLSAAEKAKLFKPQVAIDPLHVNVLRVWLDGWQNQNGRADHRSHRRLRFRSVDGAFPVS